MTDLSSGSEQFQSLERGRERDDSAPQETAEWLDALDAIVAHVGKDRAQYLFDCLADLPRKNGPFRKLCCHSQEHKS